MGLTKEVREFFTKRINRLLNEKLEAVYAQIDKKAIQTQAVSRFLVELGVPVTAISRYVKIEEERSRLSAEQQDIKNYVFDAVQKKYPQCGFYRYANNFENEVERIATHLFENKVLAEVHPDLVPQIAQINRIKEDVESVVLLSTSETKLVSRLTEVLKKYGGDISELLDYIPE
jgi:hypothetical protein